MERNLIGGLNIMKEMGAKPNFSDVARRYGTDIADKSYQSTETGRWLRESSR